MAIWCINASNLFCIDFPCFCFDTFSYSWGWKHFQIRTVGPKCLPFTWPQQLYINSLDAFFANGKPVSIFCGFLELNCDTVKSSSWFLHLNCRIGNIAARKAIYMRISLFMIQRQINSQLNYCQEGYFVIAMIVYDAYISSGMNIYWMAFTDTPYDEYMYIHRQARAFIVLYILYYKIHIKIEFTIQKTFHFFSMAAIWIWLVDRTQKQIMVSS